ncbi:MAG: protein translocase subunit SecD [Candidatus Falkowbacteria bacterium]|nr:protein translocase subunit SecD [Candidatus Falkowbacteria bacterium]
MRLRLWILIGVILLLIAGAAIIDWPSGPSILGRDKLRLGLDLQGGSHLVYVTDLSKIADKDRSNAISSVIEVIRRRIDALGVTEPVIQQTKIGGQDAVIVELPGVSDIEQAKGLVGKTAQLEFYEQGEDPASPIPGFKTTGLNGSHLTRAEVNFGGTNSATTSGGPEISLTFTSDGAKLFKDITTRNVGKPVAIVLDQEVISAPTVQSVIEDGKAVITGKFTVQEAKNFAIQLNAGALPVPINLVQEKTVGATLGTESIRQSLMAGIIGAILVALFMIVYYRYLGVVASVALIIYSLLALAIFKLVPVTMTLAGVAGFILSIGMAVDANILIFERTKEEERLGKDELTSIEEGFSRAWPSIRDSNFSTLITCIILFYFGTGIVRGFALTLGIGVLVSMFSAITVTKTILELLTKSKIGRKLVQIK